MAYVLMDKGEVEAAVQGDEEMGQVVTLLSGMGVLKQAVRTNKRAFEDAVWQARRAYQGAQQEINRALPGMRGKLVGKMANVLVRIGQEVEGLLFIMERWHAGAIWWRWAARTAPCASSASPRLMLRVAASRPTGQAARAAPHPLSSCGPLAPSAHGSPPWPGAPHRPTATPLAPRWALCMRGQRTGRSTCSTASAVERRGA